MDSSSRSPIVVGSSTSALDWALPMTAVSNEPGTASTSEICAEYVVADRFRAEGSEVDGKVCPKEASLSDDCNREPSRAAGLFGRG
jgi:hypothetical protein